MVATIRCGRPRRNTGGIETNTQLSGAVVDGVSAEGSLLLRVLRSRELVYVLVGIGLLLRIAQYLANRSLWIDEAWLALNLVERPVSDLTGPLDFNQGAPIGFLLIEGVAGKVLGYSEYALRLFPLVSGLVSIPVFALLTRRILSQAAAPFAIFLFVVADGLIYYSSEVKAYETDVAVAVCLLAAGTFLAEKNARRSRTAIVASLGGLVLLPLSFPAVFVVAAVVSVLAVRLVFDRQPLSSPAALAVLVWGPAALGIAVFGATRTRLLRESLSGSGRFLGVSGSSPLHALNVMGTGLAKTLGLPQQSPFNNVEKLALLCAVVGAIALLRRNRTQFAMLVAPFAMLFAASAARIYPILERTELFLAPVVALLVAEGVAQIARWTPARARPVAAFALVLAIGAGPIWLAGDRLVHPRTREEIKPVLAFVRDHWHTGDTLYVHYEAQYALVYYDTCKCFRLSRPDGRNLWRLEPLLNARAQFAPAATAGASDVVLGRYYGFDTRRYIEDLDRVRNRRRVWFLYTHVSDERDRSIVRSSLLPHLAKLAKKIEAIDRKGAHAYLYELIPSAPDDHGSAPPP
jgi:hypothetical protein